MTTIIAAHSDTHVGSSLGLSPERFLRDDGSTYVSNVGQRWSWTWWMAYWNRVAELKRLLDAEVVSVSVGDSADRNRHVTFDRVSENPIDILRLAELVFEPAVAITDTHIMIRGTEAHGGNSGWLEEELGERLKSVRNPDTGHYAWWYALLEVDGILCDFCHSPLTRGYLPYTENQAASRMSTVIRERCVERDEPVPHLAIFGHVHHPTDSGIVKRPRVLYLPSWQLPYAWILSSGKGLYPPPIGGAIVVIRDGEFDVSFFKKDVERQRRWKTQELRLTLQSKS